MKAVFSVGSIPVYGDLILAPMDGVTDMPFRALVREMGSAMSYTGFVNAQEILAGSPHIEPALAFEETERPVVFQLFDDDPDRMLQAALEVRKREPDIIDINMGCSAKTVAGRGAGAGLLCEPRKIARIFDCLSKTLDIPVTGKIRLGWDEESLNYLETAKIIEENGGSLIAVHGRTKRQGYTGRADWQPIAEVKQAVSVPVIGNGDVRTRDDIAAIKKITA
ncbi:MAG TPA: tRNA-dihydrouridine synthase family protein, partial [Anaerolineaceae bacterium]